MNIAFPVSILSARFWIALVIGSRKSITIKGTPNMIARTIPPGSGLPVIKSMIVTTTAT